MSCIYSSDILLVILNTFGGLPKSLGEEFAWSDLKTEMRTGNQKVYVYFSACHCLISSPYAMNCFVFCDLFYVSISENYLNAHFPLPAYTTININDNPRSINLL